MLYEVITSYLVLPRENEPDITIPYVFVSTSYKGVSPADIETSITVEIEKKLKGLDGVKKIQSVSSRITSYNVCYTKLLRLPKWYNC